MVVCSATSVESCSVPATALIDQAHKILAFDFIPVILVFLWDSIGPFFIHPTRLYCKHLLGRVVEKVIEFRVTNRFKGAPKDRNASICIAKCNPQHILLPRLCWHEFSSFLKKGRLPPWFQKAIFINFAAVQVYP